jgi:hypothetical protein
MLVNPNEAVEGPFETTEVSHVTDSSIFENGVQQPNEDAEPSKLGFLKELMNLDGLEEGDRITGENASLYCKSFECFRLPIMGIELINVGRKFTSAFLKYS